MKSTRLSQKKIGHLFGFAHEKMESRFLAQFLIGGNPYIPWNKGLNIQDIELFAERCNNFDIKIIGFEVHIDSPDPLHVSVFEEFGEYEPYWHLKAIDKFHKHGISNMIVPYLDISEDTLQKYLSNYE